ncbi:MAG: nucleotide sugar dehydrogenase [Desulfobacteraceae bacterium]|nr:nucleotide sugar dehydrogenase [Desulfobacteraceae bacterium]
MNSETKIAIIGLGYVGLPLAVHFGEKYKTIGYDLKPEIIENSKNMIDPTGEVSKLEFEKARYFLPTNDPTYIKDADFIIVAVPTPIDKARTPDLKYIISSSEVAGKYMKKGAVIVFESTVYPGVTEDICVPILEKTSGYKWKKDFNVGYSPERINPGDKEHTLSKIVKVVSADNNESLEKVAALYEAIIEAGIHKTNTIKEAEAAKVIENTQRDLNIALMNELALIFDKFGIDTKNVLDAANTKWNFLPFTPGLVGGHCIGVDPYYLTYKAESEGYNPEIILAGRRINDNMAKFIVEKTIKMMINQGLNIKNSKVGVLGLTFKEDCPDLRNTKVIDIVSELKSYSVDVMVHDPIADSKEALDFYNIEFVKWEDLKDLSALIVAVSHKEYKEKKLNEFTATLMKGGSIIDIKSMFDISEIEKREINFFRL